MTKQIIVLRTTPNGRQYYEINRVVAGAFPSTKNHQGGIRDEEDESANGKMFKCPGSARCPVHTVKNYLLHLNPEADFFSLQEATSVRYGKV